EESYAEALAICRSIGYDLGRANALNGLGDVRRQQSKYTEAQESYAEAVAISKGIGNGIIQVNSALGLARIRLHQARYAEAKALVEVASSISERVKYVWGMDTSGELLENIFVKLLSSLIPASIHAEDSTTSSSLPVTDEFSAARP
ncbi:hypothetical protein M407DRAFT_30170, partial [Tulasnella calospora MUT 4182]